MTVTTQLKLFVWYDMVGFVCLCEVTQSPRLALSVRCMLKLSWPFTDLKKSNFKSHLKHCKFKSRTHAHFLSQTVKTIICFWLTFYLIRRMVKRPTKKDINSGSSRYALRIDSSALTSQYACHGNTFLKLVYIHF